MNLGSFAGGMARGISQGIEDQARRDEMEQRKKDAEWKGKERTRQEDEWARQDAFRKKLEGIDATNFMKADNDRTAAMNEQNAIAASAGRIAQGEFKNPAASVLMLSGADQPSSTFSADTQQRKDAMPAQAVGLASVAKPASLQLADPSEARKGLYAAALDAQYPKQQAATEIPLKTSPSLSNHIEAAMQVLATKQKYGQDTSMDQVKLQKMSEELDKEGAKQALPLFHGRDFANGLYELNNNGKHINWKIEGAPQQVDVEIGGVTVPSQIINLVNDKGDRRQINTSLDMYAMMGLDKQIAAEQKGNEQDTKGEESGARVKYYNAQSVLADAEAKNVRAGKGRYGTGGGGESKAVQRDRWQIEQLQKAINPTTGNPYSEQEAIYLVLKANRGDITARDRLHYLGVLNKTAFDEESRAEAAKQLENDVRTARGQGAPTKITLPADVPPPEKRIIGKSYQTPKGMMIWRGNGWSAN